MPRKKQKDASSAGEQGGPEENRRWILELLDGSRERQEAAFPEDGADAAVYFAHLNALMQLTEIFYRKLLKPHQVSQSEFRVLSSLRLRGPGYRTTPLELNRFTQITSAGMTRTLDRLAGAGYVERSPNPEDRRSILIGLTEKGWTFAETLGQDAAARYADMLAGEGRKSVKPEIDALRIAVERLAQAITR
ncbi:MAG: MarR family winged helix-turn-helix transcriptional regulator [Myxococcota bacterium]